jgi:Protein of unknown function (DUF3987)
VGFCTRWTGPATKTIGPFTARRGTARARIPTIGLGAARFGGRGDDGLIQRFQLAVWPDVAGRWRNVDRWPDAAARGRAIEVFQRLNRLEAATVGAEELTPEEVPFLRFEPAAQELFDSWRAGLEQRLRLTRPKQPSTGSGRIFGKIRAINP